MNVIAIVGLETIKDKEGNIRFFAETFLNNIKTFQRDNPKSTIKIFDGRNYVNEQNPIAKLWSDIAMAFDADGIDIILYSGHSDSDRLYWISKTRPDLKDTNKFISNNDWNFVFNSKAFIRLMGCQAGGQDGVKWPKCVAQTIADNSGVTVWAFTSKCSQQKRNGGYYQIPDNGDYVKFERSERVI